MDADAKPPRWCFMWDFPFRGLQSLPNKKRSESGLAFQGPARGHDLQGDGLVLGDQVVWA